MQARIILTTKCNLNCSYCCNEYPEIQEQFKVVKDLDDIDFGRYTSVALTGGEPLMLELDELVNIVNRVRAKIGPENKIYLYTNMTLWNSKHSDALEHIIDGVSLGLHEVDYKLLWNVALIASILIPIKIRVWEKLADKKLRKFCNEHWLPLVEWKMDECDVENEDRYIIGGWNSGK